MKSKKYNAILNKLKKQTGDIYYLNYEEYAIFYKNLSPQFKIDYSLKPFPIALYFRSKPIIIK